MFRYILRVIANYLYKKFWDRETIDIYVEKIEEDILTANTKQFNEFRKFLMNNYRLALREWDEKSRTRILNMIQKLDESMEKVVKTLNKQTSK